MNKSDKLTKQEFEKRLKEYKFFTDPEVIINYKLPVIQYYLTNISNINLIISQNGKHTPFSSRDIIIEYREEDFALINQAFESIKIQLKL